MRTTRAEALLLFRRWLTEQPLVRCDLVVALAAVSVVGRVTRVSEAGLEMVDERGEIALRLPLATDFDFWFKDMADFPKLAGVVTNGLTLIAPFEGDVGDADMIIFAEYVQRGSSIRP